MKVTETQTYFCHLFMLKIKDKKFFLEIIADAVAQAHLTHSQSRGVRNRWIKAIAKATSVILEGDADFIHWDTEKEILYFWSPVSNEIYETGEKCHCPAFLRSIPLPCYHRAMRNLVKNYFQFERKPGETPKTDFATAVFFDPELSAREKVDLLNLSISEGRTDLNVKVRALQTFI